MEIHQIKSQLSITQVLGYYHIEVKRKHVHCPFHEDKTPSMQVYLDTGTVYCFSGNCDKSGKAIDVIDFIMYKEQLTKHQAINKAKQLLGTFPLQTKALATSFAILQNQV
ncbi:MAG: CHC2 zinc finger domain-containing protein, partial [Flavobacteriaceae bacterium]|nr:CHC2 zinc finger domain-containing protein [Flavobacteriaceae bacterium]